MAPNDFAYGVESWGLTKNWLTTNDGMGVNSHSARNMVQFSVPANALATVKD